MSVSVVIPVHNGATTIGRAVVSAAMQSPAEVVVIDDASTDDTVGVVEQIQVVYPCVRLVRHAEKAVDWQQAAADVYPSLKGSHVVCMGADDKLENGIVESVSSRPHAAVVFHDYWVCGPDHVVTGSVVNGFEQPAELSPEQMRARIRERQYASETGIGSGIRKDMLLWLNSLEWWTMGPWSDAIGYAAVAVLHGAVYVPGAAATFTINDAGYGHQQRNGARQAEYHEACRRFLRLVGLPFSVSAALCTKRAIPYG